MHITLAEHLRYEASHAGKAVRGTALPGITIYSDLILAKLVPMTLHIFI